MVLAGLLAAAVAVVVTWTLVPRTYTVRASLLYEPLEPAPPSLKELLGEEMALPMLQAGDPGATILQVLTSRTFAAAMVEQFNLCERFRARTLSEAARELSRRLDVRIQQGGLIEVQLRLWGSPRGIFSRGEDPEATRLVADIVCAMLDKLRAHMQSTHYQRSKRRRAFLEQQVADAKEQLHRAVKERTAFEERSGLVLPSEQFKSTIGVVGQLDEQLALLQPQLEGLRRSIQLARKQERPATEVVPTDTPVIQELKKQLITLQNEWVRLEEVEGRKEEHPDVVRVRTMVEATERQLANELNQQVGSIEVELIVQQARYQALKAQREHLRSPLAGAPQRNATYEELQRRVTLAAESYAQLYGQYVQARVEEESEAEVFEVLDEPLPPEEKSGPSTAINALLAFFLASLAGILWTSHLAKTQKRSSPPSLEV